MAVNKIPSVKELDNETGFPTADIVHARASISTSQGIPHNTNTRVNFDDVEYDSHSAISTGSSWTFTAPLDGMYIFVTSVVYNNTLANANQSRIYFATPVGEFNDHPSTADSNEGASLTICIPILAGESVNVNTFHNEGNSRNITSRCFFQVTRILPVAVGR